MDNIKVLALDYGSKRVGLASGDTSASIAFPRGFIDNKNKQYLLSKILEFCNQWEVKLIVFGLPLNMNESHSKNKIALEMDKFMQFLSENIIKLNLNLKIDTVDERLTTFEAQEIIEKYDEFFNDYRDNKDSLSAQIILQRWFDSN